MHVLLDCWMCVFWLLFTQAASCVHAVQSAARGSLKDNYVVVGLAVKHLGMRPSQAVIDQAVFSFLAMCTPRCQVVCRHLDQLSDRSCVDDYWF